MIDATKPTWLRILIALNALAYSGVLLILTGANVVEETGSLIRWAIQCLPLLLVLPGMLTGHYRAYSWLGFIVILYFIPAVLKTLSAQGHWSDAVLLLLTCILFVTAGFSSRGLQRLPTTTETNTAEDSHGK